MTDTPSTPNIDPSELDDLRYQYHLLQEKMQQQRIVTDSMIQDIISQRVGGVQRTVRNMAILGAVAIVLWIGIASMFNLSVAFTVFTVVMMIADMVMDQWAIYPLRRASVPDVTPIDMAARAKQSRRRMMIDVAIGTAVIIPWAVWAVWELIHASDPMGVSSTVHAWVWIVGVSIGGAVGLAWALYLVHGMRKSLSGLAAQIEDYKNMQ